MANNVPNWAAQRNGLPGNLDAVNDPAGINQFLGAHQLKALGYGNPVVTPTSAWQGLYWVSLGSSDWAQKFTMSGTSVGRVTVPIQCYGNGADLLVSLCPDNAGAPNQTAPIAQTKIPAALVYNLTAQYGVASGGPLAHPAYNSTGFTNYGASKPWISPAATVNGAPSFAAIVTSGNYTILIGGLDTVGNAAVNLVFTAQYNGSGSVAAPVPQPSLPVATYYGAAAATQDTVIYMGGQTNSTTYTSAVWAAGWNPNTGVIGSWSSQVALPAALTQAGAASWGSSVYLVGGSTTGQAAGGVSTVYRSTVSNGQLSSWTAQSALPQALSYPYVAVIGDWLIVCGGLSTGNAVQSATYYAPIRPDGSLGAWKNGPAMVGAAYGYAPGWGMGVTDSALIINSGASSTAPTSSPYAQVLSVGTLGVANAWAAYTSYYTGERATSVFSDGAGNWGMIGYNVNNTYIYNAVVPEPSVSVPLNATGLTSGNPYWVVVQQYQGGSSSDYLRLGNCYQAYSTDMQVSRRWAQSWSSFASGFAMPITVYDTTAGGQPVHTVEDPTASANSVSVVNQRWTQLIYSDAGLLQGVAEVTQQPNNPLNQNPTFASGVSPWTATNGTITQSSAQTHGGYAYSGLLTPTGGFTQAYAQSEYLPVDPGSNEFYGALNWYVASGWFYTPTAWSSFSLNVSWYDSGKNYLSTSAQTVSLAAATWTEAIGYFACPAGAAYATIQPAMNGSPAAANTLYMSNVCLTRAPESVPALASVAQITYPAASQANAPTWPPSGVTQLA